MLDLLGYHVGQAQRTPQRISCHGRLGPPGWMKQGYAEAPPGAEVGIVLVQSSPWISLAGSLLSTRICRQASRRPKGMEIS
jgi:hypothetical protein